MKKSYPFLSKNLIFTETRIWLNFTSTVVTLLWRVLHILGHMNMGITLFTPMAGGVQHGVPGNDFTSVIYAKFVAARAPSVALSPYINTIKRKSIWMHARIQ